MLPSHGWDCHHMSEAYLAARKSKDRRTQVGAVIVPVDHVFSLKGYNGPLRGLDDSDPTIYEKPPEGGPSPFMAHAERNAISNAARAGISIYGCCMYSTLVSCEHCAADIVQGGIFEVIFHQEAIHTLNATQKLGIKILRKANVNIRFWSGTPLIHEVLYDGQIVDVSKKSPPVMDHMENYHDLLRSLINVD